MIKKLQNYKSKQIKVM